MKTTHLLTKKRSLRKLVACSLAIATGVGSFLFVAPSLYAQSSTTAMCFRGRTINVPNNLVSRYESQGATVGACPVSPS